MRTFQPPPTWALPVSVDKTAQESYFNPIWLKGFVDLSRELSAEGGYVGGTALQVLHGDGPTWSTVVEADITLINVATNNVSIARHGFAPTLPNDVLKFFNGAGGYTIPLGLGGTVTDVAALTLGTTGTDLSSTVANGTTTPVITLQVPTASAANRGALSAADWSTFNAKQAALSPAALSRVDDTNVTMTLGGTPLTALLQAASMTLGWTGQLSVARGGTGGASSVYLDTPFTSQTSILVTHNFGKYPLVNILDNTGAVVLPLAIIHASLNAFTTTFSAPTTGNIIAATGF